MSIAQDEGVEAAVRHWAPRFVANGVDFNDFYRITEQITSWDGWCAAWSEAAGVHRALGETAESEGHHLSATQAFTRAAVYYHYAKFVFVSDPEQWMAAHSSMLDCYRRAAGGMSPPAQHLEIPFEGTMLSAYLRVPSSQTPPPLVIILPGLDSVKEEFPLVEQDFLDRRLATLSLDGPGQGETSLRLPIRGDYETAVSAVIDFMESMPEIDTERIGVMGVSLGG